MAPVARNLVFALSFGVAAYVVVAYAFMPLGALVHPDMRAAFTTHAAGVYVHAFGATVALVLGPLQFSSRLRRRFPAAHRWCGRLYLAAGVLVGGLAGASLAWHAYGGAIARLGFATLAALWLFTGWRAYRAARAGSFAAHRAWMERNFALTFAAVTLRIYVPLSAALGIEFAVAYPVIAWLCWVPNLLLAQWHAGRDPAANAA
jgi:uncharacterized membrane protein